MERSVTKCMGKIPAHAGVGLLIGRDDRLCPIWCTRAGTFILAMAKPILYSTWPDSRGYVLPFEILGVKTRALVFASAETIDVWPCCFARDERQFIWADSHYFTVLVVLRLDPVRYVTHSHGKHRREA